MALKFARVNVELHVSVPEDIDPVDVVETVTTLIATIPAVFSVQVPSGTYEDVSREEIAAMIRAAQGPDGDGVEVMVITHVVEQTPAQTLN